MARRHLVALSLALLTILSLGVPAAAAEWAVAKITGIAWIANEGVQPVSLGHGTTLPGGSQIRTEPGARAMLVRNKETMLIGPDTVLTLPRGGNDARTRILQKTGTVRYDVEKKNVKHFSVETPFLAAVVKGTVFTVSIGTDSAEVEVERGRVEVSDPQSGEVVLVRRQQTAAVSRSRNAGGSGITMSGPGTTGTKSGPALPDTGRGGDLEKAETGSASGEFEVASAGGTSFVQSTVTTVLKTVGVAEETTSLSDLSFEDFAEINTESGLAIAAIFLVISHAAGRMVLKGIRRRKTTKVVRR